MPSYSIQWSAEDLELIDDAAQLLGLERRDFIRNATHEAARKIYLVRSMLREQRNRNDAELERSRKNWHF